MGGQPGQTIFQIIKARQAVPFFTPMNINVNIIHVWEGPRHDRLRNYWRAWTEATRRWNLRLFANVHNMSHAECYQAMWEAERDRPERYCVFTEHDFLPSEYFPGLYLLDPDHDVAITEYVTRDPMTYQLQRWTKPGAWFVLIDKERAPRELNFGVGGDHNDPCNVFVSNRTHLLMCLDCWPSHYGVAVEDVGQHLFWARHYNDDPSMEVAGFSLRDIHRRIDRYLAEYEQQLPAKVKECLQRPASE